MEALELRRAALAAGETLDPNDPVLRAAGWMPEPPKKEPTVAGADADMGDVLRLGARTYAYADGEGGAAAVSLAPALPEAPKIIYASRTHSQLSQVISELKRSGYTPRVSVLGSREQLCVNPSVSRLNEGAQTNECRRLCKSRACLYKRNLDD